MIGILQLRWRLAWAAVLLWVAGAGRTGETKSEVHLYLADLHYKLADEYKAAGRLKAAARERRIASEHAENGPPAFTDARMTKFE